MGVNTVTGDITKYLGELDYVAQGNNCYGVWGNGVALALRSRLPKTYALDRMSRRGDVRKLGTINYAREKSGIVGICCYIQLGYSWTSVSFDLLAFTDCLYAIANLVPRDARLGIPAIGGGTSGGNWETLEKIIRNILRNHNVTIYLWR